MINEKIAQAISILNEKQIDAWLIFVRESHSLHDPSLELILGAHCTWQSAFFISANGETIAIVGNLDAAAIRDAGAFKTVIPYTTSIRDELLATFRKIDPKTIAINYSTNNYMADGLTHGMYMVLCDLLQGTDYPNRFISSEAIVSAIRGRKSPAELSHMKTAIRYTQAIFDQVTDYVRVGMTEQEIANFMKGEVEKRGLEVAWDPETCPSVFTGPDTAGAHYGPTSRKTAAGHIMNIDFGVKYNGYCSDMQRTWYFKRSNEKSVPEAVLKAFNTVRDAIEKAAGFLKPGVQGHEVDNVARQYIIDQGFAEYPHGLGHQIGRAAHDGAGTLCPVWERYGNLPFLNVEQGQVYTLEPRVTCEGYGVATIEEEVVVTKDGCEFLSDPQRELYIIE
ncbi:aminopeptidase P family protein [candidate division KSB1 bacterium]|nr:aminopeptidase P family protein [candidate division KSB1 bacterium]